MKNKIIVATDLTKAAGQAIKQATAIAVKSGNSLTLLHVLNDKSLSAEETEKILSVEAETIFNQSGVHCEVMINEGNIFEVIPYVACEHDYDLMVIGTHGIKGIKQMLFGANILKLAAKICMPVLVVQEESPLIETVKKLVLPVSSHETFASAVDAVLLLAEIFNPEVHLYSIHKAGFEWPEQMLINIEYATRQFESKGVNMIRVKEDQNVYSLGYAKQTLKYAHSSGADFICMMSIPSKEYYYFAPSDKETMIMNEDHLPILCTGGGGDS
jgi:nucleotide-binding universal stress UspA family protein